MRVRIINPTLPVMQPKRLKVCAYCRVSTDSDEQSLSLENQTSTYERLINSNSEYEFAGIYHDKAMTGSKEKRPGLQQMLSDARAGKIDLIITKSISRLARNTVTILKYSRELKEIGVGIFFEEERINTLTADGEVMLSSIAAFAEEELRSMSANQKWTIQKRYKEGITNAQDMMGYSAKTEINPFFGKILCGECGRVFGRKTWSNKDTLRKVWQCNARYEVKCVRGCNNRHIEESALEQIFIIAWNTIIENIETCRAKWKAQANGDDLLTAYRAKEFLKLTENAESINKVDTDFMIRVLDNITIYESGNIIISFYDGTKIENIHNI